MGSLRRLLAMLPEEVWFFLRIAAYAIFIGVVYWFLTYEAAGSVLLIGFGIAAGTGAAILGMGARARNRGLGGPETAAGPLAPDGPFGDESGRLPGASVAPLILAVGLAIAGLGLVFGPWLLLAGLAVGILAALDWGRSAGAEYLEVERETSLGPAGGPAGVASVGPIREAQTGGGPSGPSAPAV